MIREGRRNDPAAFVLIWGRLVLVVIAVVGIGIWLWR